MKECKKVDTVETVIKEILLEYYEKEFIESYSKIIHNSVSQKKVFTLEEIIDTDEQIPLCIFINTSDLNKEYSNINRIFENHQNEEYCIYILLNTVQDIVRIKNELKTNWKAHLNYVNKSDGLIKYVHIPNEEKLTFSINITSCINNLEFSSHKKDQISEVKHKGCVYTCKLEDLMKIYNDIGSKLFDRNLRYKISDTNDVEEQIENTLDNNPEDFWFYNNGVSMLAFENLFVFNKEKQIIYKANTPLDLQVINGAQTISCSTEYKYKLEYMIEDKKKAIVEEKTKPEIDKKRISDLQYELDVLNEKKNNLAKANVLLRIIYIDPNDKEGLFSKDVSIALNRQKPIKNTDIKFFTPEIQYINDLYKNNGNTYPYFHILKSGEEPTNQNCCDLITFAKVYAIYYLQKPGTARNGKGSLLSKNSWNTIVMPENINKDKNKLDEYFNTRIHCFSKIKQLWEKVKEILEILQEELTAENEKTICKYSSEYFTAYISYILNEKKDQNFKDWKYGKSYELAEGNLRKVIDDLVKKTNAYFNSKNILKIESNNFKTDTTYIDLKIFLDQCTDIQDLEKIIKSIYIKERISENE